MADVSYAGVIRTVNGLLKTKYPEITRYGNDTVDQAVPPYFFVECVPVGAEHVTKNMLHKGCSVLITYMQKTPAQMDNLEKAEEIGELLGMTIRIGRRELLVLRYGHEYIGEKNNILQISFALDWWEDTQRPEAEELMEHLHTEMTVKGD